MFNVSQCCHQPNSTCEMSPNAASKLNNTGEMSLNAAIKPNSTSEMSPNIAAKLNNIKLLRILPPNPVLPLKCHQMIPPNL